MNFGKLKNAAGPVFVVSAGILWGMIGIFVRRLNGYGLDSMQVVAVRVVFAAILTALVLIVKDRSLFRIRLKDLWCFIGTGVCSIAFFNFCYFKTISLTSLSAAAVLLYTAPVMVMIMSVFLFKEKMNAAKIAAAVAAFAGCALASGIAEGGFSLTGSGLLTGLGSAIGYALYSIFGRYALDRGYGSLTITFYTFVFAALAVLPLSAPFELAEKISLAPQILPVGAAMGAVVTVLPYLLYTAGLSRTEPGKASVMASSEPAAAAAVGAICFGESLDLAGAAGIALVILSVALLNLKFPKGLKKGDRKHSYSR